MTNLINLQLFAEDASAGEAETADDTTVVEYGIDTSAGTGGVADHDDEDEGGASSEGEDGDGAEEGEDREAAFEALIKGEYKDLYKAKVSEAIKHRFKVNAEAEAERNSEKDFIADLAEMFGTKDLVALRDNIISGSPLVTSEAEELGLDPETYAALKKRELDAARAQRINEEDARQREVERIYGEWEAQSIEVAELYPDFDLETELMTSPKFARLLEDPEMDVKTAYEAVHAAEILATRTKQAAATAKKRAVDTIRAKAGRPVENGAKSKAGTLRKANVSELTAADRKEIVARAKRGEKISF